MQGSPAQQSETEMNDPRLAGDGRDGFLEAAPDLQAALVLDDFPAAYQQLESGAIDQYGGEFVAFLNKQLAGTGPDSVDLRMKISQERHVDPERIAIIHIFNEPVL